jgi:hypothetical protein
LQQHCCGTKNHFEPLGFEFDLKHNIGNENHYEPLQFEYDLHQHNIGIKNMNL